MSTARKTAATRRKPLDAANDAGSETTGTEYLDIDLRIALQHRQQQLEHERKLLDRRES